ncbi:amidase signature enzyme [Amylocystis lapponica]|nr:amidase signature enzyme [Amylocystis lapponica]
MFSYWDHRKACAWKQQERKNALDRLPPEYSTPVTEGDQKILSRSLSQLVSECSTGNLTPPAILQAYGKRCLLAHRATNCLTDVLFDEAQASSSSCPEKPLLGVPISLKDCIDVEGHDTTTGYSVQVGHPSTKTAPLVRLLRDAGALVHVKTTVPTGLLAFETLSDIYGQTTNPYNPLYSPGASTGGGAALLSYQGSVIDVGTDIGGSIRFPAASCGIYSLKGSSGRFPAEGCLQTAPGLLSVPTVTGPMSRSLEDLEEFWIRVMKMQPWEYDHSCVPLPWRSVDFNLAEKKPKWGVIWDDGVVVPSPACKRALLETVDALRELGCDVITFIPPNPVEGLRIGYSLALSDGGAFVRKLRRTSEYINDALNAVITLAGLPRFVKNLFGWSLRVFSRPRGRNDVWATLASGLYCKSVSEEQALVVERETYRAAFHAAWREQGIDLLLTVPYALPSLPLGGSGAATLVSAHYAFLYNVSAEFLGMNDAARGMHSMYDARAMHGLPLAVQVIGGYMQEEKTLEGMKLVKRALREAGREFLHGVF